MSLDAQFSHAWQSSPPPVYVTVPAVILDLKDIHHGSAGGQSVVCITRGRPAPVVEWFVCRNIKQ